MRRIYMVASAIVLALAACSRGAREPGVVLVPDTDSLRTLDSGQVVGFEGSHGNHAWRGIPFARPPLGELRWRAPREPEAWSGTREALASGSACPQFATALGNDSEAESGSVIGSEDCLYLNVFSPRFAPDEVPRGDARLPVMVWIHGGGNTIGHAGTYDGGRLAATRDVIVVTTNYRMGAFGWFRHPALAAGDPLDDSGNYGTLDMIRALEWVRDNASAFGGDPDNVTIFGESAGGTNVFSLLVSPAATGLFHRAIIQSGSPSSVAVAEAENYVDAAEPGHARSTREATLALLVADGAADRSAAKAQLEAMAPDEVARYLRSKTPAEVLDAYAGESMLGMYFGPWLIRDGAVLPVDGFPRVLAQAGSYNEVPVLLGTNRDETKLFQFMSPQLVRRWFWLLPRARNAAAYDLQAEYNSSLWKATGADEPAAAMRGIQGPSVFAYRFDWDEEPSFLWTDLSQLLGASHGLEIPFVFGTEGFLATVFNDENRPGREALSAAMMSYWTEFAYSGDPGRGRNGTLPLWSAWDDASADADKFIVFDTQADGGIRMSSDSVTTRTLVARLGSDPRIESSEQRCTLLAQMRQWGGQGVEQLDLASAECAVPAVAAGARE